jgi:hypothetical protein
MIKTKVDAGVCGFQTEIEARCEDYQNVSFQIESNCKNIQELAAKISTVDAFEEIKKGFDGVIMREARDNHKSNCAGCVVPPAIFKTMQAAASLALPKNASIEISKKE